MRPWRCVYLIGLLASIPCGLVASSTGRGPIGAALAEPPAYDSHTPGLRTRSESRVVSRRNELESVLGREVRTRVEEDLGRIIDLLVDPSGHVQAAVIEFGGFLGIGTRKIAVEWPALRFDTDRKQPAVIVDVTRDQLRVAPEYKPSEPAVVRRASD